MMSEEETPEQIMSLPLDAWHRAQGARMVPFAGYEMPIQYEGIVAEHEWTRTSAGLFDVSHMGQLLLSGPDLDAAQQREVHDAVYHRFHDWLQRSGNLRQITDLIAASD